MGNRDIERQIRDAGEQAGDRVRRYADHATLSAHSWFDRGRRATKRFNSSGNSSGSDYSQRLSNAAEDFADEANYRYRRLRRQVNRNPAATIAIVAGTIGAFLLLRRAFRRDGDED